MKKSKIIKKIFSVALCAALVGGSTVVLPVFGNDVGITVSAEKAYGDFNYEEDYDTITISNYHGSDEDVTIPALIKGKKVTCIGNFAFSSRVKIKSITIPSSVKTIGNYAFLKCTGLTSISIGSNVTSIGRSAFSECTALASIKIPEKVKHIDQLAFENCTELKSVTFSNGLECIDEKAFKGCTKLASITIPGSVKTIGSGAFSDTSWYNKKPDGMVYAGKFAYKYKGTMPDNTSVTLKSDTKGICDEAFHGCTGLAGITIPDSVNMIGFLAFAGCSKLKDIKIPDSVETIGYYALADTMWYNNQPDGVVYAGKVAYGYKGYIPKDTTVTIKPGTKTLGYYLFEEQSGLKSVKIPDSVTTIEPSAFYYCTGLKSLRIPDSVKNIRKGAFQGCTSLTSIRFPGSLKTIEAFTFTNCTGLTSMTIPESVTNIEEYAFYQCKNLKLIRIPDSVKSIEKNAFCECTNLTIYGKEGSYSEFYAKKYNIKFKLLTYRNTSTLSASTIVLGDSVTVNCSAAYGTAPYTYSVYYRREGSTKWTTAQSNNTNATVNITPKAAMNYEILVEASDADGKTDSRTLTLTVNKPLQNTSVLGSEFTWLGEKAKVRCSAEGGLGNYQYAVYYKKSYAEKWVKARGYSTSDVVYITPKTAVKYDVRVYVKDGRNKVAVKNLTLTVRKKKEFT